MILIDFEFNLVNITSLLIRCLNYIQNYWIFYSLISLVLILMYFCYVIFSFNNKFVDLSDTKVDKSVSIINNDLPPHYPNGWIPVIESSKIQINRIENFKAFGHQMVAFRGQSGRVYVMDAFCPHLGANIGVGGKVTTECGQDCIRCPFHGWTFRGKDGLCVKIPELESNEIPVASIKVWKSQEINDILFVWYNSENVEPLWFQKQINKIHNKIWKFEGRTEHIVNCHFQEIPENGPDRAHLNELHSPAVMSGNVINKGIFYDLLSKVLYHEWESEWWTDPIDKHIAHMSLNTKNKVFDYTLLEIDFTVHQIGPAFVELHFKTKGLGGICGAFLQMVTPLEPNQNRIIHRIYAEPTLKGKLLAKFLLYGELRMLERDIIIWNNKKFIKNPIFSKKEKSLVQFRRWFRQFYSNKDIKSIDF